MTSGVALASVGQGLQPTPCFDFSNPAAYTNGVGAGSNEQSVSWNNPQGTVYAIVRATTPRASGKWYFEATATNSTPGSQQTAVGIVNHFFNIAAGNDYLGDDMNSVGWQNDGSGSILINGIALGASNAANGGFTSAGPDYLGIAVDIDNGLIWFQDITASGNWNDNPSADPATGVGGISLSGTNGGPWYMAVGLYFSYGAMAINGNDYDFLGNPFVGSIPSGFRAWGGR